MTFCCSPKYIGCCCKVSPEREEREIDRRDQCRYLAIASPLVELHRTETSDPIIAGFIVFLCVSGQNVKP